MKKFIMVVFFFLCPAMLAAQEKKTICHEAFEMFHGTQIAERACAYVEESSPPEWEEAEIYAKLVLQNPENMEMRSKFFCAAKPIYLKGVPVLADMLKEAVWLNCPESPIGLMS